MTDVAPELLEAVRKDFTAALENDKLIAQVYRQIADSTATHKHSNAFAQRVGELLADALQANISADKLPDGRMYYNIAQRVLEPLLTDNYELAADVAAQVQELLNNAAGFGMKAIKPKLDAERVENIINKVSSAENYDDVAWMLDEPVVNFTQTAVDDTIRENVEFHAKSGLSPKVTRTVAGGCCEWCSNLAGVYDYPVSREIYRRHNYCRCLVLYDPGDGRKQNVHSKQWVDPDYNAKADARKVIGLKVNNVSVKSLSSHVYDQMQSRNVSIEGIKDAIIHPLKMSETKYDSLGRPSLQVIGEKATIAINPEDGNIISTWPTHTKLARKLKRG